MKRVAIYVRVSTQEQKKHGLSVDAQITALRDWIKDNGYIEAGLYNDAGISARKKYTKRPAIVQLIRDCQAGKVDLIVFTKLDRFFRAVGDYYEVIGQLNEVPWRAIWEDYETETASGVFKVNIMLSVAQNEADRTSERLKSTFAYKKARGDYIGKAPTGYKLVGRDMIKDPDTEEAMTHFFETYLETKSVSKAMKSAKEYGLGFEHGHILKLMRNPAYCGEAANGYKCEPYITKEQHLLINEYSKKQQRQSKAKAVYLFSGLLKCGYCGKRMSGHTRIIRLVNGGENRHKKYDCHSSFGTLTPCPHLQVTERLLEVYLLDNLDNIVLTQVREARVRNSARADIEKKRKALETKLKRLSFLFEEGDIEQEEYLEKRNNLKLQLQSYDNIIIAEPTPVPDNWREMYQTLDEEARREFWLGVIKEIIVTNENKANPTVVLY